MRQLFVTADAVILAVNEVKLLKYSKMIEIKCIEKSGSRVLRFFLWDIASLLEIRTD